MKCFLVKAVQPGEAQRKSFESNFDYADGTEGCISGGTSHWAFCLQVIDWKVRHDNGARFPDGMIPCRIGSDDQDTIPKPVGLGSWREANVQHVLSILSSICKSSCQASIKEFFQSIQ
jgi:hypothetical protein